METVWSTKSKTQHGCHLFRLVPPYGVYISCAISLFNNANQTTGCQIRGKFEFLIRPYSLNSSQWSKFGFPLPIEFYLYLWQHSHGAIWIGITNCVDHVADGETPGSKFLCELIRDIHSILSPLCVAKTPGAEKGSRFALTVIAHVFNWSPVCWRTCKAVLVGVGPWSVPKPVEPSLQRLCRYTCKV